MILFFLSLVLITVCNGSSDEVSNSAVISSEDSNLVLKSGKGKNIYLKGEAVFFNGNNLIKIFDKLSGNATNNESPTRNGVDPDDATFGSILQRMSEVENQLAQIQSNNQSDSTPRVNRRLVTRVAILERKLRTLMQTKGCYSDPCQNGGTCISVLSSYFCLCPNSWEGKNCDIDVNECHKFAGTELGCQNGAKCVNKPGTFECVCSSGWFGVHCTKRENDCSAGDKAMCDHGICVQTQSSAGFNCICDQGWKSNGTSQACSIDIDECEAGTHHCSTNPKVKCVNIPGSYTCGQCPPGYTGDGYECSDIDECQSNNGGCSVNPTVACYNTVGSRICAPCPPGFQGDGITCTLRGRCSVNNGGCHPSAQCIGNNAIGGQFVQCICPSGMVGKGVGIGGCRLPLINGTGCESNPCQHGECYPVNDGFTCICSQGYGGARCDVKARDMACKNHHCRNGATCVPDILRVKGYTCICPPSFEGLFCERQGGICGHVLNSTSGNVTFPDNSSTNYTQNMRCAFVIATVEGMALNVTFSDFQLESSRDCMYDFLQIHDGSSTADRLLGIFCGNKLPLNGTLMSTHNKLYFWFRSDDSMHGRGFAFTWQSVKPQCGAEISIQSHGVISSPGSPGKYPPNRDCLWSLSAEPTKRIQLQFYNIDLESHPSCNFDYLAIYDGEKETDPLLKKYCNQSLPEPILSSGPNMLIHFHSDSEGTGQGFQLSYSLSAGIPGCNEIYTNNFGDIQPPTNNGRHLENLNCVYVIRVEEGKIISMSIDNLDIVSTKDCIHSYIAIYNGESENDEIIGRFCRTPNPKTFESTSNKLMIKFKSGSYATGHGFKIHYRAICKRVFRTSAGIISSPGYPNAPFDRDTCVYSIIAPPGKAIQLSIVDLDINNYAIVFPHQYPTCYISYVEVFDGPDEKSRSLAKMCNGNKIPSVVSKHNQMFIKCTTIGRVGKGFLANYSTFDIACGGIYTAPNSTIYHHSSSKSVCKWIIIAPPTYVIETVVKMRNRVIRPQKNLDCSVNYYTVSDLTEKRQTRFCDSEERISSSNSNRMEVFLNTTDGFPVTFFMNYSFVNSQKYCGGTSINSFGTIRSPGFPDNYPNHMECIWKIRVKEGQQIKLKVKTFELERQNWRECIYTDYLEIRNGPTEKSSLIGKYCGKIPPQFTSTGNALYLHFNSDVVMTGKGFELEWEAVSSVCGASLVASSGEITSPNYPQYDMNLECYWKISTSSGSKLRITFQEVSLPQNCSNHYVEIYDGTSEQSPRKEHICDGKLMNLTMTKNLAFVKFHSAIENALTAQRIGDSKGFFLKYSTDCNANITGYRGVIESPNFPNNSPINLTCKWVIRVDRGNKIAIKFTNMFQNLLKGCKSEDYVVIQDGGTQTEYCDLDSLSKKIVSQKNEIAISYHTALYRFSFSKLIKRFRLEWAIKGCGGKLSGNDNLGGILSLPKDRSSLENTLDCNWEIEVNPGKAVKLTVTVLNLKETPDCTEDYIDVYDDEVTNSTHLARICHFQSDVNYSFTTKSNKMIVKMTSSYVLKDFKANYRTVSASCGNTYTADTGFITSPKYPQNYENNALCVWSVNIPRNNFLRLELMDFDLDTTNGCMDNITISYLSKTSVICGNQTRGYTLALQSDRAEIIFKSDSSNNAKGFRMKFSTQCGGYIDVSKSGVLRNNKNLNSNGQNCTWILRASNPGDKVYLTMTNINIPKDVDYTSNKLCPSGYLKIFEGENELAPLRGEYCGQKLPHSIVSKGNALTVQLGSYTTPVKGKFSLFYSSLKSDCGGTLTSLEGSIATPNYPEYYSPDSDCEWNIKPSPGNKVSLSFTAFDLEFSEHCNEDYLEIREQNSTGRIIGVFCGDDIPDDILSSSLLYLRFHSGENSTGAGFMANYQYVHGASIVGSSGVIASPLYPDMYDQTGNFSWTITSEKSDSKIFINLEELAIESETCEDNYLKIYDGNSNGWPLINTFCGAKSEIIGMETSKSFAHIEFFVSHVSEGNKFKLSWNQNQNSESEMETITFIPPLKEVNMTSHAQDPGSVLIFNTDPGFHLELDIPYSKKKCRNTFYYDMQLFSGNEGKEVWKAVDRKVCSLNGTYQGPVKATNLVKVVFYLPELAKEIYVISSRCGGYLSSSSGFVELPASKDNKYHSCEWTVKVRNGKRIKFSFVSFNVTAGQNDTNIILTLFNGETRFSPVIGRYWGNVIPDTKNLKTFNSYLFITLTTKYSEEKRSKDDSQTDKYPSFKLHYEELNPVCGFYTILDNSKSTELITTPNYPNIPEAYISCSWTIMAPPGEVLMINFTERFDVSCLSESVDVYDGGSEMASKKTYCGKAIPPVFVTSDNGLLITYKTEQEVPSNGFKAYVSVYDCGGEVSGLEGKLEWWSRSGILKQPCKWHIARSYLMLFTFEKLSLPKSSKPCATKLVITGQYQEKVYCHENATLESLFWMNSDITITLHSGENILEPHSQFGFKLTYNKTTYWWRTYACGGDLSGSSGRFGYDLAVPGRICSWRIKAPNDLRIVTLKIDQLNITSDIIYISEGRFKLGTIKSNKDVGRVFKSSGPTMDVMIYSDSKVVPKFKASYDTESPTLCTSILEGDSGVINEKDFPTQDFEQYQCSWTKKNIGNATITIKINFNVGNQSNNSTDCSEKTSLWISFGFKQEKICTNTTKVIMTTSWDLKIKYMKMNKPAKMDIEWKIERRCGGVMRTATTPELLIKPPKVDGKGIDCIWHIRLFSEDYLMISTNGTMSQDCESEYWKMISYPFSSSMFKSCRDKTNEVSNLTIHYIDAKLYYHSSGDNSNTTAGFVVKRNNSASCGGDISVDYEKNIKSPNYPQKYDPNRECEWTLTSKQGTRVRLDFVGRFNIEKSLNCTKDALIIYDYKNLEYKEMNRLCGREQPPQLIASENMMKIILRTDNDSNSEGFNVKASSVCGGVYEATEDERFLYSSRYPIMMHTEENCTYKIVAKDHMIYLDFVVYTFQKDFGKTQCTLQIDGEQYTGSETPPTKIYRDEINMKFSSNFCFIKFKALFRLETCGGNINQSTVIRSHADRASTYSNDMNCRWNIQAPEGQIIVLNFLSVDLEGHKFDEPMCFDYIDVYDGSELTNKLGQICGVYKTGLLTLRSTGNRMTVIFKSDAAVEGKGFQARVDFTLGASRGCGGEMKLDVGKSVELTAPKLNPTETDLTLNCVWTVSAPEGFVPKIEFTQFNFTTCWSNKTCTCDYVEIKELKSTEALSIAKYCGAKTPGPLLSSTRDFVIVYRSSQKSIFKAIVSATTSACGATVLRVNTTTQTLKSPGFDKAILARGLHCTYQIMLNNEDDDFQYFHLKFNKIDLDAKDRLYIIDQKKYNKKSEEALFGEPFFKQYESSYDFENLAGHVMHTFNGSMKPFEMYFSDHIVIKLITSNEGSGKHAGFSLDYTDMKDIQCLNYTASSGRIRISFLRETINCTSLITVPPSNTITLNLITFPMYFEDYIDVYDGSSTKDKVLYRYTKSTDVAISSSGSKLLLRVNAKSDVSTSVEFSYYSSQQGPGCGGELTDFIGVVSSPNYPSVFQSASTCEWVLKTFYNTKLVLHFENLDLGPRSLCDETYIHLLDKNNEVTNTYCSDDKPADFKSADNYVKIVYKNSLRAQGTGWRAKFIGVVPDEFMDNSALLLDEETGSITNEAA